MDSKYIGLILAICSSLLIGVSFVITKKGLQQASSESQGKKKKIIIIIIIYVRYIYLTYHFFSYLASFFIAFASDSHRYLRSPIWWTGLVTMVSGEILNFIGKKK